MNEEAILAIQIFDQKKFKKKDQGFLGVVNVKIGSVIDLEMDPADGNAPNVLNVLPLNMGLTLSCRDAYTRPQKIK